MSEWESGDGVMNGPDEIPDRARLELQEDSLAVVELSARDSATFVSALLDPKPVNARLQDTVRRYRDQRDMRSEGAMAAIR
jgi:hypothetical protein